VAGRVLRFIQEEREKAGISDLSRRDDLDRIARARAGRVAALPHARRLSLNEPIEGQLEAAGIVRYARASTHTDMNRGYPDPGDAFARSWRRHESSWSKALNPRYHAVGIATARADDGWVILATILLEELPVHDDAAKLEEQAVAAVNEIRREHGLRPLAELALLAEVARAHSRDMAQRDYFQHASPEGRRAEDRVREQGIRYVKLGENIQKNRGFTDPVARAVRSWMESRSHRETILTADFRETGVGVATTDDGTIYFTQLFVLRRDHAPAAGSQAFRP
jgi:uncharacterized protein YkwD